MSTEFRYFFDDGKGQTIELTGGGFPMSKKYSQAVLDKFPDVKALKVDCYDVWIGVDSTGARFPVTRKIEYKRTPSLHECNARCMAGSCRGVCECRCGGKNHGIGRCA